MEQTMKQVKDEAKERTKTGKKNSAGEWTVNGFLFSDEEYAQAAEKEQQKIQLLESKINYSDLPKVRAIYEKAVAENIFSTSVGLFYLKGMRDFLIREEETWDGVLPKVPSPIGGLKIESNTAQAKRREKLEKMLSQKKDQFRTSVIINVLLAAAMIAMFVIALNSENPNILNYEKRLTDRYAAWEQELTQREQAVRQKELELLREE